MASTAAPAPKTVTKKPKTASKEKKGSAPKASHPTYFQMIKEALMALHEKGGSSPYAIAKYMEEKHKAELPANFKKILGHQLKNSVANGKLLKVKASYKLSEASKKAGSAKGEKKPKTAKPAAAAAKAKAVKKTETVKKAAKPAKKVGVKKTGKATPMKRKAPKSIKSPAAKRAKKA